MAMIEMIMKTVIIVRIILICKGCSKLSFAGLNSISDVKLVILPEKSMRVTILGVEFISRCHSITTWTRRGGEGVSQMSTIVHARDGGGHGNVHVDKILG